MSTRTVDITTTGRRSGAPRTIETWVHERDGRDYLSGRPGPRGWYANLRADPRLTVDGRPATARLITEPDERADVLGWLAVDHAGADRLQAWLDGSPLAEIEYDD